MSRQTQLTFVYGSFAVLTGALVNLVGDHLLGIKLEFFFGVYTFSPLWIVDLFVVPFFAGLAVAMVYGLGGKLLCYFAPIVARVYSYYEVVNLPELPEGYSILPMYYWVMILIVAIEAAAFGGVAGEILVKRTYGRRPRAEVYKERSKEDKAH